MRSTFFGLSSALSGIMANQRQIDTVNHNVDNADSPGYTRQRVDVAAAPAWSNPAWNHSTVPGQLGTGVQMIDMTRMRDQFIDLQFRSESAKFGTYDARATALDRLNRVVDEPGDAGITSLLNKYFGAWTALQIKPEGASQRQGVRAAGVDLAQGFKDMRQQLLNTQAEETTRINAETTNINTWATQINDINLQIFKVEALGHAPNDLKDQRDILIDKLAATGNVALTTLANGKVTVSYGGQVLVDATTDTVNNVAVNAAGVVNVGAAVATLTDGSLKGHIDVRDTIVGGATGYLAQLDTIANTIITQANAIHAAGFGLNGGTGVNFFTGTNAGNIAVDPAIMGSTDAIAASATAADLIGGSGAALNMAHLATTSLVINGATTTIGGSWSSWVSKLGIDTDQAGRLREAQKAVLDVATARRDSVSGVNLDEEITDMVKFQKSYNAAARMMTTIDSMLETIVTRMGLVGR